MGNPFAGYYVGIKEVAGENAEIWFNNFLMGELDRNSKYQNFMVPWKHGMGIIQAID
jgi:hypothetical protein